MLVLFESAAGYAVFKVLDEKKLKQVDEIWKEFETADTASEMVKLVAFKRFKDTEEAVRAALAATDGKVDKSLKKLLRKSLAERVAEPLGVSDARLGVVLKEKLSVACVQSAAVHELMRGIRSQLDALVGEVPRKHFAAMALGMAHGVSRYKLKFNPDKIDTMIIQAVSLLDDLDKELNNYSMRCREWYGWHFPELGKVVDDHQLYAKFIKTVGMRQKTVASDLSDLFDDDLEAKVKSEAEVSMGTEISDTDLTSIQQLCEQIIEIGAYRQQLFDYLRDRMMALAPNLTVLLGEMVAARLISHAGSLVNLAKSPASTIQILGAEKALFRALKSKRDTPKYGLIYHAQLIGQTSAKLKGKVSRMVAAKAALACRVDALGEETSSTLGIEQRAYLEKRMLALQEQGLKRISGTGKARAKQEAYSFKSEVMTYDNAADSTIESKKRKFGDDDDDEADEQKKPKKKRAKIEVVAEEEFDVAEQAETADADVPENGEAEEASPSKKSKKKKKKRESAE